MSTMISNPLLHMDQSGDGPSSDEDSPASIAVAVSRVESRDDAYTPGAGSGSAAAIAAFRRHDTDGSGFLDREEIARVLRSIGEAAHTEAIDAVLAGRDALSLHEFATWHASLQSAEAADPRFVAARKVRRKLGGGVKLLQSAVRGAQEVAARPVAPESLFVIDKRGNDATRQSAEVASQISERFSSEFHHLEDQIRSMEHASHWGDVWRDTAERSFDAAVQARELGWTEELVAVAVSTMIESTGQRGYGTALHRVFLRVVAPSISGRVPGTKPTAQHVRTRAQAFAISRRDEIEELLSEDHIPIEAAVGAVHAAMEKEVVIRRRKIGSLQERLDALPPTVPAGITISGLRGDASASNGTYVVSGLRCFFGRPIWTQRDGSSVLFFDASHNAESEDASMNWADGVWALAPTLNSGRCTAWIDDPDRIAHSPPLTSPDDNSSPHWMVYDTLKARWLAAPGNHCPLFTVESDAASGDMSEYLRTAVRDQSVVLEHAEARLAARDFDESVRVTMAARAAAGGTISRSDYSAWQADFYGEELRTLQKTLEKQVVRVFSAAFSADTEENRREIQKVITDFTTTAERSIEDRKYAKRRFLVRISRPAMARAFFAWKLAARRKVTSSELSGGTMFQEPQLPWNVRHPRSDFTSSWEAFQVVLLVYIAFMVPWRICFGVFADVWSLLWIWEALIDVYFTVDVVLNMHTAFYDSSGDLQGLNAGGGAVGKPDYKLLYSNYLRGWMIVDVASVLPVNAITEQMQGPVDADTGSKLQLIKGLRLMRLTKLLRLARGIRFFAKYEEVLGPSLKAFMLVMVVVLLFHVLNCVWFSVGMVRSGWVDHKFGLSDTHTGVCHCHNRSEVYYDSVERMCVDATDTAAELMKTCSDAEGIVPSLASYYLQSMMTALNNPSLDASYTNTVPELLMSASITGVLGFVWGAVAGAWGTIFSANQMASQNYRMKLAEIKEFCRVKGLEYGVKAKLLAHYEHLYPEQVIVDDHHVLDDLPPLMRSELVRTLYGNIITSVPLFLGLDRSILTELCMALMPEPALKRQMIAVEGSRGVGLHCISSGACRVTQTMRGRDDEVRVKMWIEDVFEGNGRPLNLYSTNQRLHLERLLSRLLFMTRQRATNAELPIRYRDVYEDHDIEELVFESGIKLTTMLVAARKQKCLAWSGPLRFSSTSPDGPVIELSDSNRALDGEAPLAMLCAALRNGVVMLDLLNFLVPDQKRMKVSRPTLMDDVGSVVTDTIALTEDALVGGLGTASATTNGVVNIEATNGVMNVTSNLAADATDAVTVLPNLKQVCVALTDPSLPFRLPPDTCLRVDDLRLWNKGTFHEQHARQQRVLKCLLDLAFRVSTMDGYIGPRLDAVTLGTIGPGEFFGELSLLPLSDPWRHKRTHTAVANSILYFVSKETVESLARRFPDLKHLLADHAEDYSRLQVRMKETETALSERGKFADGVAQAIDVDPVAHLQEALAQLDTKVCESDSKVNSLSAQVSAMDIKLDRVLEALGAK